MCFFTGKNKEAYFCSKCLADLLREDPYPIYNMSKLGYTWKEKEDQQKDKS
jgi:hypothetical protein